MTPARTQGRRPTEGWGVWQWTRAGRFTVGSIVRGMGALGLCLLLAGGCATSGTLRGSVSQAGSPSVPVPVTYTTQALGPSGTLSFTLPDGETFAGPYTQGWSTVEGAQSQVPGLGGVFFDWGGPGARGFMDDDPVPVTETQWSSQASATLSGNRGHSMSCRFRLSNPSAGIAGGGEGR